MRISDWSSDVCSSDLDDPRRPRDYSAEQSLKSSGDMAALFDDVPDAIDNALALATRCNLELALGTYHLPAFPVPRDRKSVVEVKSVSVRVELGGRRFIQIKTQHLTLTKQHNTR